MYICCRHKDCERASQCEFGRPHEWEHGIDDTSSRCHDIRPYVAGGIIVWSIKIEVQFEFDF